MAEGRGQKELRRQRAFMKEWESREKGEGKNKADR